jgi:hypothetical protein
MKWRGTSYEWEGDWSIETKRYECESGGCQTSAEVIFRTFIPIDIARAREAGA